ncbi:MAG: REP-associated tyrosine transposase [Acidobacteriota bacterium]|jgi:hypothetical protein|nr:REP-associated tyrosine transposase [Acidobacteriota bacterium]
MCTINTALSPAKGALGRAGIESTAGYLLLWVPDSEKLALFMGYVNSNLAREAGRLVEWREKFWSRRYRSIVISDEEGAQVGQLKYVLSLGPRKVSWMLLRIGQASTVPEP